MEVPGGSDVNIDSVIRKLFFVLLYNLNTTVNLDGLFVTIAWAFERSTPSDSMDSVLPLPGNVEMYGRQAYTLIVMFSGYIVGLYLHVFPLKFLAYLLIGMERALNTVDSPPRYAFVRDEHSLEYFLSLFPLATMDMKVGKHVINDPGKYFVSYGGMKHSINQLALLQAQGYKLEHAFKNDTGQDFIRKRHRVTRIPDLLEGSDPLEYIKLVNAILR